MNKPPRVRRFDTLFDLATPLGFDFKEPTTGARYTLTGSVEDTSIRISSLNDVVAAMPLPYPDAFLRFELAEPAGVTGSLVFGDQENSRRWELSFQQGKTEMRIMGLNAAEEEEAEGSGEGEIETE